MNLALASLLIGLGLAAGVWLIWQTVGRPRKSLETRIAPYVSDVSAQAHDVALQSVRSIRLSLVRKALLARGRDSDARIEKLIRRSGLTVTAGEWIVRRTLTAAGGAVVGAILGGLYGVSVLSVSPFVGSLVLGGVGGWVVPLWALHRRVRMRSRSLEDEMSAGLDLLCLCAAAGEDLVSALARVSALGSGPFSLYIRDALAQISLGIPVAVALESCTRSADVPALTRVVDHLTSTLERGTPIVDVLIAQANDVREDSKNRLLESAGRNEVVMLIPLVFLILPVTIAFAVYPGLVAIQTGF